MSSYLYLLFAFVSRLSALTGALASTVILPFGSRKSLSHPVIIFVIQLTKNTSGTSSCRFFLQPVLVGRLSDVVVSGSWPSSIIGGCTGSSHGIAAAICYLLILRFCPHGTSIRPSLDDLVRWHEGGCSSAHSWRLVEWKTAIQ